MATGRPSRPRAEDQVAPGKLNWTKNESRQMRMQDDGRLHGWFGTTCYMETGFVTDIFFAIVSQRNITLSKDRVGNWHELLGTDGINGYGHFYMRAYWTNFGLHANTM
eukprot:TRINITY_DN30885_c0_g1_i1.p2 TRINITY_DN30885_c0_g1~~TRINITY_DN30885_c0_g1_i1.p2  ORF type:complete len:108 (-),score=18.65 TRINITY_DN30885_c0_g1_i1:345-668(-)